MTNRRRNIGHIAWSKLLHLFFRLSRGLTIGVRAVVTSNDGKFLLVRHTYTPGWHFPGGGVEPAETVEEALEKELLQETGLQLLSKPQFHGIFFNGKVSRHDHILVYICKVEGEICTRRSNVEIAELGWFDSNQLPDDIDPGTKQRLQEIEDGLPKSMSW